MQRHRLLPFGTWPSTLSAKLASTSGLRFGHIQVDQDQIYLASSNPAEKGRTSLYKISLNGSAVEITSKTFSVKSQVHEYGGKAFSVYEGLIVLSSAEDQQLYVLEEGGKLRQLTKYDAYRFIDFTIHPSKQFLIAVLEDHSTPNVKNALCSIDLLTGDLKILAEGYDFYAYPRMNQDGTQLAWIAWNHPQMPWDGTELFIATLTLDGLIDTKLICGSTSESILEPQWKDVSTLHFVSDRSSYWNLYEVSSSTLKALHPASIDIALPLWVFGNARYTHLSSHLMSFIGTEEGTDALYLLDTAKNHLELIDLPFTSLAEIYSIGHHLVFIGASFDSPPSLYSYHTQDKKLQMLMTSQLLDLPKGYISKPMKIKATTEKEEVAYGFYYPPQMPQISGKKNEKPPLIVKCHGGPTSQSPLRLALDTLFFTTRGFGVLDVNYGGSTGYGRAYRERLFRSWGLVDIQDCIHTASHLIKEGLVDPKRMVIKGGSAGGFTALCGVTFHDTFQAAVSYFGVCDLVSLAKDTHKFEKEYLHHLIGPYPECADQYIARSPMQHVERISKPIVFFQGKKDFVVPLSQAENMHKALLKNSISSELIVFEDEGHGFKSAETIETTLEAELKFYQKLFGLTT